LSSSRARREVDTDADQRFQSWVERIRLVQKETVQLFWNRKMFQAVARMFETNEELRRTGDHVWWWLAGLYGRDAVMAVRRELDGQAGVLNLYHLLHDMERNAAILTRRRYRNHARILATVASDYVDEQFHEFGGPPGPGTAGDYISPQAIARDRKALQDDTAAALEYAQRLVAHRTPVGELDLTLREVDRAVQALHDCLTKYYAFLTGSALVARTPVAQFNIVAPFRIPWATDEYAVPDDD